jgi:taurine dioxygenase
VVSDAANPPCRRLDGPFGVEITGGDANRLDSRRLLDLVHEHQLLAIRDQSLDPVALERIARGLGVLDVYPFGRALPGRRHVMAVVKNPGDEHNFGGAWHTDSSYLERPPALTLLYAVELPAAGGDTLFADMCAALEALSPGLRGILEKLEAHNTAALVHDAQGAYGAVAGESVARRPADIVTDAVHPVVRVHPATGRQALYVSRIHTERFAGMTREESLPLIDFLQDFATRPERVTRLTWRPGTLAIWDNRTVQHYPQNDYTGQRREMYRLIVRGERPQALPRP